MLSLELDGALIGVAVRGEGPREEFARALAPWRTDRVANHNYSVWFSNDRRRFHRLQWGGCVVVRTRDPERFGRGLALHLGGHGVPSRGLVRTDGVVAIHDGRATVIPSSIRQSMHRFERPLREGGVVLHDAPWVDVNPYTGEVFVDPPRLAPARFDAIVKELPRPPRPDPVVDPGAYPLAAWYFPSLRAERLMSKAEAVATVLTRARWPLSADDQLPALGALFEQTPFGRMPLRTAGELLDQVRR